MKHFALIVLVVALVIAGPAAAAPETRPRVGIGLAVRVEHGDVLSRVTVWVTNTTDGPFTFTTGAYGGNGSLDDGFRIPPANEAPPPPPGGAREPRRVTGSPPTVVPEIAFDLRGATAWLRPPAFGGATYRSMRPASVTVPPGGELLYASFAVPTTHAGGELVEATMLLEDGKRLSARRAIPTTRPAR